MTVQAVPYALQNASHSAAVFRQSASAPWATGGVIASGELTLAAQGTPNMSIVLGPGRAKVVGTSVSPPSGLAFTTQAMYDVLNDANLSLTVTTANATNPRIDAAWIGVQDAFYTGSTNTALAGITAGVPAATPVAPSIPVNSQLLGYVAVAANATTIVSGNITSSTPTATLTSGKSALVPIIPTGVVGSNPATTNVTIGPNGKVSMLNVTNCQLQGVFTAAFDNYRILIDVDSMAVDSNVYFRYAFPGGALNSANYYTTVLSSYSTGAPGSTLNSNVTSLAVGRIAASGGNVEIDVFRPALPKITRTLALSFDNTNYLTSVGGTCSDLNQYDGLLFFSTTTGINGNIRIYGYNNN